MNTRSNGGGGAGSRSLRGVSTRGNGFAASVASWPLATVARWTGAMGLALG